MPGRLLTGHARSTLVLGIAAIVVLTLVAATAVVPWAVAGPPAAGAPSAEPELDVTGDGVPDVLTASGPMVAGGLVAGGSDVQIWSRDRQELALSIAAPPGEDSFGWSVAAAGDIDGDGVSDVAVSAPGSAAGSEYSGRVMIHSGSSGQLIRSIAAPDTLFYGLAVAGVGDYNGDGIADIAVSGLRYREVAPDDGPIQPAQQDLASAEQLGGQEDARQLEGGTPQQAQPAQQPEVLIVNPLMIIDVLCDLYE